MSFTQSAVNERELSAFERLYPWPPVVEGQPEIAGTDQIASHFIMAALQPGGLYDTVDRWRHLFRAMGAGTGVIEFGKRLANAGRTRGDLVAKAITETMRMPVTTTERGAVFKTIAGHVVRHPLAEGTDFRQQREARMAALNRVIEEDFRNAPSYYGSFIGTPLLRFAHFPGPVFEISGRLPAEMPPAPDLATLDVFTSNFVSINYDPRDDLI